MFRGVQTFIILCVAFRFPAQGQDYVDECINPHECYGGPISENIQNFRQEGAVYLQKVMDQLQQDKVTNEIEEVPDHSHLLHVHAGHENVYDVGSYHDIASVYNVTGPSSHSHVEAEILPDAPPLSLSKEELMALYEAALQKASQLDLFKHGHQTEADHLDLVQPSHQGQMDGPQSGYYYYYFPIKSFFTPKVKAPPPSETKVTTTKPQQVHATVTMIDSGNKSLEPLFMAISSFIGMALMILFSILVVPRFHKIRSKNSQFDQQQEDVMANIGQIFLEAMAGRDCSERLACEIARIFRGLKSDNKTLRVLEIILPPNLSQQISQIRRAAGKRAKCGYIDCKSKIKKPPEKPPIKTYKLKPWKVKETPHDLWMKHFEKKKKPPVKKPPNLYYGQYYEEQRNLPDTS